MSTECVSVAKIMSGEMVSQSRCVMGYKPISDQIISIRLDGHPVRTTIIQIILYAPTSEASEDDIEESGRSSQVKRIISTSG